MARTRKTSPAKKPAAKAPPATTTAKKPAPKAPPAKATAKEPAKKAPAAKTPASSDGFAGFPADAIAFLAELDADNDREWFERNRGRYESAVRGPALAFIAAMAKVLPSFSKQFVADPRPVGGSLMRIHRDVRFSSDKRPYKTNIGIHLRHAAGKDVHAPGIYIHIDPTRSFVGAGVWHPEPEMLAMIRARIVAKPREWTAATTDAAFSKDWAREGESLVRPPKGFDPEHEHIADLKRKDHIAVTTIATSAIRRADLPQTIAARLAHAKDFVRFLCAAADQPF